MTIEVFTICNLLSFVVGVGAGLWIAVFAMEE